MKVQKMKDNYFKWKQFESQIIILTVRWYLKYPLSYRNLVEMMGERGINVVHTTIMRWVHQYAPQINNRVRRYLKSTNDSWRVDETYIKVKGEWNYLYRAVDSNGNTLDFMLSSRRDKKAAKKFFKKVLKHSHNQNPRVITVDKNAAYPPAIDELKKDSKLNKDTETRQIKYLNNIIEQDHRSIKRITNSMLGFKSFKTARRTLYGIEAMNMIRKGQVEGLNRCVLDEVKFINKLFGLIA